MVCAWTLVKVALVLCVLSLIFQILGYSCPGWLVLTIDLSVVGAQPGSSLYGIGQVVTYAAVWYVRVCTKEGLIESCSSSSYHDATFMGLQLSTALTELAKINWTEIEVETTLGLAFCLAGVCLTVISLCEPCAAVTPKLWAVIAAGLMFASAIVLMPTVIKFSEALDNTHSAIALATQLLGQNFVTVHSPWSMALTATGMALAFICCLLLLIAACKHNEQTSGIIRPNDNLPPYGYPIVMPTMFSNYHSMPMANFQMQDRNRLSPIDRGRYDYPVSYNHGRSDLPGFGPYLIYNPSIEHAQTLYHPPERSFRDGHPPVYEEYASSKRP